MGCEGAQTREMPYGQRTRGAGLGGRRGLSVYAHARMYALLRGPGDRLLLVAFALSGAAALGYELLWTRLLALTLGHETYGVLGVLAGFFFGMALGAAALHRRAATTSDPLRLFVRLELIAAGFAAASPLLLVNLARWLPPLLGPWAGDNQDGAALALTLTVAMLALLPGTFCLGATLPTLVALRRRALPGELGARGLGRLYAANTFGAVLGALGSVYVVLPGLGFGGGALALASLGVGAALVARAWARGRAGAAGAGAEVGAVQPEIDCSRDPDPELLRERWLLLAMAFGTGLVGLGYEVVGLQILGQRLEGTIFTFAHVLAIYLLGTALGAAIYQRLAARALAGRPATVLAGMLLALAASVVPAAMGLAAAPSVLENMSSEPATLASAAAGELTVAALVFGLPTLVMGALFSHVIGLLSAGGAGRAYALNTAGAALAPFVFGLWAIPRLGYSDALYAVSYAYLALFSGFCWVRRFPTTWLLGGVLGVVALTAAGPRSLDLITLEPGWRLVERRETLHGVITVAEGPAPAGIVGAPPMRRLQVGQNFRMGGALSFGEQRMGHLPLLLHPAPSKVLFLGVGAGATAGAAANFSAVREVTALELVPEVLALLHHFHAINNKLDEDRRFTLRAADARRALAATRERFDVVIGDLFHPGRDGAASLFAQEHFVAVRERLAEGGIYCQWLPLHQLDEVSLKTIARTFLAVFPGAQALLGLFNARTPSLALCGSAAPLRLEIGRVAAAMAQPGMTVVDPRDLLASWLLDAAGLAAYAGEGPVSRDLAPRVLFSAPIATYAGELGRGAANLEALLAASAGASGWLKEQVVGDAAAVDRLLEETGRYRSAMALYLQGEIARARRPVDLFMEEDLGPYLAAYEADPSFPPARGLLYGAAARDPAIAAAALPRMLARTPEEPRVYEALLQHLQRIGDREGFERVRAAAAARFGGPPTAPSASEAAPTAAP